MIRVKKVVGESYDLETGQKSNKALMLENSKGATTLVAASEKDIAAVLALMAADLRPNNDRNGYRTSQPQGGTSTVVASQEDIDGGYFGPDSFGGTDEESHYDLRAATQPAAVEDDYDPGEQYGDPSSGLPSI